MSMAYDRVEWDFLGAIMLILGFAEDRVGLVMRCVRSVSYSFRINHNIIGTLMPQRGLRQGDPLSPYLFVLCAQGLSSIISKAVDRQRFQGVRIARSCPTISHLFSLTTVWFSSGPPNRIVCNIGIAFRLMRKPRDNWSTTINQCLLSVRVQIPSLLMI